MARKLRLIASLLLGVCLLFSSSGAFAVLIEKTDYVPSTDPSCVGYLDSLKTWWHDGGPPHDAVTPNDDCDVWPDKNHDIGQFKETVAPASLALVGAGGLIGIILRKKRSRRG